MSPWPQWKISSSHVYTARGAQRGQLKFISRSLVIAPLWVFHTLFFIPGHRSCLLYIPPWGMSSKADRCRPTCALHGLNFKQSVELNIVGSLERYPPILLDKIGTKRLMDEMQLTIVFLDPGWILKCLLMIAPFRKQFWQSRYISFQRKFFLATLCCCSSILVALKFPDVISSDGVRIQAS